MDYTEFKALRADVEEVERRDVHLGRVLHALLPHLAYATGLDVAKAEREEAESEREARRADEDARLKAEAEARQEARAAEDAQPHTPEQLTALSNARAAEDAQVQADAEKRAKTRAEEDDAARHAAKVEHAPASVPAKRDQRETTKSKE